MRASHAGTPVEPGIPVAVSEWRRPGPCMRAAGTHRPAVARPPPRKKAEDTAAEGDTKEKPAASDKKK